MGIVKAKGVHGDYEIVFGRHKVDKFGQLVYKIPPDIFEKLAIGAPNRIDAAVAEQLLRLPKDEHGMVYDPAYVQGLFFQRKTTDKLKDREFDLYVTDVPVTHKEAAGEIVREQRSWVTLAGGALLMMSPVIVRGYREFRKRKGRAISGEKKPISRTRATAAHVANLVVTRRGFLGALAAGFGLVALSNILSPISRLPTEMRAFLHSLSPNFFIEGRSVVVAARLESIAAIMEKELGRRPRIAVLNLGFNHAGIVQMLENPSVRKNMLVKFFERIQQIPPAYRTKVYFYHRDSSGKISLRELEIPPLFSPQEIRQLQRSITSQRRRAPRRPIENVKMTRSGMFDLARKPLKRAFNRRA